MSEENKYQFWKRMSKSRNLDRLLSSTKQLYTNKYYNLWMSKFKFNGLDEDMKEQEQNYIMRKLWSDGTVAIRNIANTDMIALMPYSVAEYNYLDFPEVINLVNERDASRNVIPAKKQIVNKDVCILYCTPSHKPIKQIVDYYVERMSQAIILINNNLCVQNMPFIIPVDETNKDNLQDIVDRILDNQVAVFTGISDISKLQVLLTQAPYLIDKLQAYVVSLENELLTILGVDNSGTQAKKAQMLVDEVNSNNDIINDYGMSIEDELKSWLERANKVLNRSITIEAKSKPVDTTHDYEDKSIQETKQNEDIQ